MILDGAFSRSPLDKEIKKEQLALLYAPVLLSHSAIMVNSLVLLLLLWRQLDHVVLITWFVVVLITVWFGFFIKHRYVTQRASFSDTYWEKLYLVSAVFSGLAWASASFVLFTPDSVIHQFFLAFILAGMSAGAVGVIFPSFPILLIFLLLLLVPYALRLCFIGDELSITMGALVVFYIGVLLVNAKRFNRGVLDNIRLRIEAHKRGEQLHESEVQHRLLFEQSGDALWVVSDDRFRLINQSAVELLGYGSKSELLGQSFSEVCLRGEADQEFSCQHYEDQMRLAQKTGHQRFEWRYKREDSEIIPVDVNLTSIQFQGETAILCSWRDISLQKKTEQILIKAKQAADSANQSKSAFLATMSHEIRTPIHGVIGMVQLLEETGLDARQKAYVETIRSSGEALLFIINEILDLSKIEAGEMRIEHEILNVPDLMNSVFHLLQPRAKDKGLEMQMELSSDIPKYQMGDGQRIRQVLTNLVANAIKFTEQGQIRINLKTTDECIRFEIKDSGIGIGEADLKHLFQPFRQLNNSTSRTHAGSGLGLAISKKLVEMMGGSIGVNSRLGLGSCFWFTLPLRLPDESELRRAEEKRQLEVGSRPEVQDQALEGRILLAEDNELNAQILHFMLSSTQLCIDRAMNGEEVLALLRKHRYDLILMDCQMPLIDGYETTRMIRAGAVDDTQIPVIAITANASSEDRQHCLSVGMNDFISKPFEKSQLMVILRKWLLLDHGKS